MSMPPVPVAPPSREGFEVDTEFNRPHAEASVEWACKETCVIQPGTNVADGFLWVSHFENRLGSLNSSFLLLALQIRLHLREDRFEAK
jgi:hypothetical protein